MRRWLPETDPIHQGNDGDGQQQDRFEDQPGNQMEINTHLLRP